MPNIESWKSFCGFGVQPSLFNYEGRRMWRLELRYGIRCLSLAVAGSLLLSHLAAAQSFDAAADFSATSNPNGAWSYGWSASRLSGFHLLPHSINFDVDVTGIYLNPAIADVWTGSPSGDIAPAVFHNPSSLVDTHSVYPFGCCAPYPVGG